MSSIIHEGKSSMRVPVIRTSKMKIGDVRSGRCDSQYSEITRQSYKPNARTSYAMRSLKCDIFCLQMIDEFQFLCQYIASKASKGTYGLQGKKKTPTSRKLSSVWFTDPATGSLYQKETPDNQISNQEPVLIKS